MARAKFVKKARKDNPAVKAGEPYYWWKFRYGGKHYSKTPPKQSQLTESVFYSGWRQVEEGFDCGTPGTIDDLQALISEAAERMRELAEEADESLMNMPDQLQDSESGERLSTRSEEANSYADELENIDLEFDYDQILEDKRDNINRDDFDDDEEYDDALDEAETEAKDELIEFIENAFEEARNANPGEPD